MPNIQPVIPPTGPFSSLQGAFQPKVSNILFLEQSGEKESLLYFVEEETLFSHHGEICKEDTSLLTRILKLSKLKCSRCLMAIRNSMAMIETLEGLFIKEPQAINASLYMSKSRCDFFFL